MLYINHDTSVTNKMFSSIPKYTLERIIQDEGYISYSVCERDFIAHGNSYFGQLLEIDIKGQDVNGDKETNLFAKKCPVQNQFDGFGKISDLYVSETFFYDELANIYVELQKEANIPIEDRYNIIRSYKTFNPNIILLDNQARRGFKTPFRCDVISLKYAKLSIQQLAKFHGLSFVLEKKMPTFFKNKITKLKFPIEFNEKCKNYITSVIDISLDNIEDEIKKKQVLDFFPTLWYHWKTHFHGNDNNLIRCLRHGDYILTNHVIKEVDGDVVEVIPIDYQMIQYGTPVIDLILFIFSCTDRQFRRDHMTYLKDVYHETLGRFLKYFDMNVDQVYPREEFEKAFKERLIYGMQVALFRLPLLFITDTDLDEVEKSDAFKLKFKLHGDFQERFTGIVNDYIDWGYL